MNTNYGGFDSNINTLNYRIEAIQNNINTIFEKINVFTADINTDQERLNILESTAERIQDKSEEDFEILTGNVYIHILNINFHIITYIDKEIRH